MQSQVSMIDVGDPQNLIMHRDALPAQTSRLQPPGVCQLRFLKGLLTAPFGLLAADLCFERISWGFVGNCSLVFDFFAIKDRGTRHELA